MYFRSVFLPHTVSLLMYIVISVIELQINFCDRSKNLLMLHDKLNTQSQGSHMYYNARLRFIILHCNARQQMDVRLCSHSN